jgi:hypothetical protein
MTTPFIGRSSKLRELTQLYQSPKAEFMILYGRRRIGKTRPITHWMETMQPRAFFWIAEPTSSADQLCSFSQSIFRFETLIAASRGYMTYSDWRIAFEALAPLAEKSAWRSLSMNSPIYWKQNRRFPHICWKGAQGCQWLLYV